MRTIAPPTGWHRGRNKGGGKSGAGRPSLLKAKDLKKNDVAVTAVFTARRRFAAQDLHGFGAGAGDFHGRRDSIACFSAFHDLEAAVLQSGSEAERAMDEPRMRCSHGSEFQILCIREDGPDELSVWMSSEEELAHAIGRLTTTKGRAYWLRKRNVHCPECLEENEQFLVECPISNLPTARYRPHDSRYLNAVGSKNRSETVGIRYTDLRYS